MIVDINLSIPHVLIPNQLFDFVVSKVMAKLPKFKYG